MKYPLTIVAGIVAVIALSLASMVAAAKADAETRGMLYALIIAMAGPTVTTLLSILRNEKNAEKLDQNTTLTQQAKEQAEEAKREAAKARQQQIEEAAQIARKLEERRRLVKEKERQLNHNLRNLRQTAELNLRENRDAIAHFDKAYKETNDVNRKLQEMRDEVAGREGKTLSAVEAVDQKVEVVDSKVSDIQRHVDPPPPRVQT